uniref:Uncharacterized protein n=1 Tax=Rhizophora mucronata TaxID=61149 RepID=A0A2P2P6U2_RHIMU
MMLMHLLLVLAIFFFFIGDYSSHCIMVGIKGLLHCLLYVCIHNLYLKGDRHFQKITKFPSSILS